MSICAPFCDIPCSDACRDRAQCEAVHPRDRGRCLYAEGHGGVHLSAVTGRSLDEAGERMRRLPDAEGDR